MLVRIPDVYRPGEQKVRFFICWILISSQIKICSLGSGSQAFQGAASLGVVPRREATLPEKDLEYLGNVALHTSSAQKISLGNMSALLEISSGSSAVVVK